MCDSEGIDTSVMSSWHVSTLLIYYIESAYCWSVCGKLSYSVIFSSLESPLLLENKEAIQTAG